MSCGEDGCTVEGTHEPIFHCKHRDEHCTSLDACCNAEQRNYDHPVTCCVCGEAVYCVCEPDINWVSDKCPIHGGDFNVREKCRPSQQKV